MYGNDIGTTLEAEGVEVHDSLKRLQDQLPASIDLVKSVQSVGAGDLTFDASPSYMKFALEAAVQVGISVHPVAKVKMVTAHVLSLALGSQEQELAEALRHGSDDPVGVHKVLVAEGMDFNHDAALQDVVTSAGLTLATMIDDSAEESTELAMLFKLAGGGDSAQSQVMRAVRVLAAQHAVPGPDVDAGLQILSELDIHKVGEAMAKLLNTKFMKAMTAKARTGAKHRALAKSLIAEMRRCERDFGSFTTSFPLPSTDNSTLVRYDTSCAPSGASTQCWNCGCKQLLS